MAFPTNVIEQIVDTAESAAANLGQATLQALAIAAHSVDIDQIDPARLAERLAIKYLYVHASQATRQALEIAAHNEALSQQQNNTSAQAATVMGVAILYSIDTASTGAATHAILDA